MQRFLFTILLTMLSVSLISNSVLAGNEYEKDAKYWNETAWLAQEKAESSTGNSAILNSEKHPGDNDFDMLWDNLSGGDVISDDVEGLSVTDPANDLDQDGYAEIIISDDDGIFYIFENTGDNDFDLIWTDSTNIGSNSYGSTTFGDFDQNGRVEALFSIYENDSAQVRFYEWDGVVSSNNFIQVQRINIYDYETSMTYGVRNIYSFGDLDGDLLNELVVCSDDSLHIFEIDNSFNVTYETGLQGIGGFSIGAAAFGDMDNDGTPELMFGHYNYQSIYIYHVTGADTYVNALTSEYQSNPADDGFQYNFDLLDVDGNGWLDLYSVDNDGRIIVTYLSADSISDSTLHSAIVWEPTLAGQDVNSISHGDGDEDGLIDFYFTSDDNHVYDYEFTGGDFTDPLNYVQYDLGELNTGANPEECVYGPDLDGDGEKELIVGYEGSSSYSMLFFLEHHVIPAIPTLSLSRNNIFFDHVWNIAELDTEVVALENIGTVDMVVDSIVSSDASFTSYLANTTVIALGSEDLEIYFTALDQTIHSGVYYVIYSNSTTSPDTLNVYGDSRARPLLYMNEFQPKGTEWVEIYNMDTNPIDLTDIGITTGRNSFTPAAQFGMPVMSEIEYFQLDADWGPITSIAAGALVTSYSTSLSLNNSQDWIYIIFKDSTVIEGLGYGAVGAVPVIYVFGGDSITAGSCARVAYAGNNATDWTGDFDATPGLPNDAPAPNLGGSLIINEVDYDENFDGMYEYIEFYNPTGSDITMNGWRFTDGDDVHLINGITVPSMGVAVWDDSTNLSISSGDVASLYDDIGVRIDQMGFFENNPQPQPTEAIGTIQRIPDGTGPNDGYDFWSSGGGVTLFDNAPTLGTLNTLTYVIFTAQIGGDSNYRSFWMNGSWDSTGMYDPNWSGPLVELTDNGVWPDTSAADNIFTGVVQLLSGTTYDWWVGSENDAGSWLENGAQITPDSVGFIYSQTCIVDPGNAGFNDWTIGATGDSINSWNNADDNLTRNGTDWSGNFSLSAGPMEFKFVVMHSWEASYGDGGVGGGNIPYTVPATGDYTITFDDSYDTYTIVEYIPDPSIIFEDDFEAYTAGTALALQNPTDWTTWSNAPGGAEDPLVSSAFANSGVNSVNVITNNDLVKLHPDYTSGAYKISFDLYVPTGSGAYFNTLQQWAPTQMWGMQVYFDAGGAGSMDATAFNVAQFTYAYDTWLHNEIIVNLEKDSAEYYLDGVRIYGWEWGIDVQGVQGPVQLSANNFFGGGVTNPNYYFDDYQIQEISPAIFADNFDSYTAGTQLVLQDSVNWLVWGDIPGSAGDPFVSDAYSYSGPNSVVIVENKDLVRLHGSLTSGVYSMSFMAYIPNGQSGYFNTMSQFIQPSTFEWAMECYFDAGGGGRLLGVPGAPVTFSFTHDTWFPVEVIVDLNQDLTELWVDGVEVLQWEYSQGGTVTLRLDANDFFGATAGDQMYMDDYVFDTADALVNGIDNKTDALPITFDLKQNYPNPFNPTTTIKFQLPKKADVKILIYNMLGQVVRTIIDKSVDAGYQEVVWDGLNESGSRVATGIYIYRMQTEKFVKSHKMIMMK